MDWLEIERMCRSLARKYKADTDDLTHEGLIACADELKRKPSAGWGWLRMTANSAMLEFVNLKNHPLSLPRSALSLHFARGNEDVRGYDTYSDEGAQALYEAMRMQVITADDIEGILSDPHPTPEQELERKEAEQKFHAVLQGLPPEDLEIVNLRYFCELTQQEISECLGISQQAVQQREKRILRQLSQEL